MECTRIIHSVDQFGADLLCDGEHLHIKKAKYLSDSIIASIREWKWEILAILEKDNQASQAGFMIAISGELYTANLSNVSSIYIEHIESRWQGWRETHYPHQYKAISSKIIATGNTFEYVLLKVKQYLDYIIKKREEI